MNIERKDFYYSGLKEKEEIIEVRQAFGWTYVGDYHRSRGCPEVKFERDTEMLNYKRLKWFEDKYDDAKSKIRHYFPITDSPEMFLLILLFIFPFVIYCVYKKNQKAEIAKDNAHYEQIMNECLQKARETRR